MTSGPFRPGKLELLLLELLALARYRLATPPPDGPFVVASYIKSLVIQEVLLWRHSISSDAELNIILRPITAWLNDAAGEFD